MEFNIDVNDLPDLLPAWFVYLPVYQPRPDISEQYTRNTRKSS